MLKRWIWRLADNERTIPVRKPDYSKRKMTDDEMRMECLMRSFASGEMVTATRREDGSVEFSGGEAAGKPSV